MIAVDVDNGLAWFGQNNTWYVNSGGQGNPGTAANPSATFLAGSAIYPAVTIYSYQSGADTDTFLSFTANFGANGGASGFHFTPPTNFAPGLYH